MSAPGLTLLERELGTQPLSRERFDALVAEAIAGSSGFAAGKLGGSERALLQYPIVRESDLGHRRKRAFEVALAHRSLRHSGVFPTDAAFLRGFSAAYAEDFTTLDAIGLFPDGLENQLEILRYHRPGGAPMQYRDQEPDRSTPADDERCWLRHLRARRLLLVCPFADLLRARAEQSTFEAVWAKTGKRWFEPASVASVEFPYGFADETRRRYATVFELLEEIQGRVDNHDFDVALIAAGGLGIPLAAHVKRTGRVGISLGGHLQVLFGVLGERWINRAGWRRRYFNESWIPMPSRYVPDPDLTGENYW